MSEQNNNISDNAGYAEKDVNKAEFEYALPFNQENKKKNTDENYVSNCKELNDYALPFDKNNERKKNNDTEVAGAFDDLDDYVYAKPVKISKNNPHKSNEKKKKFKGWRKWLVIALTVIASLLIVGVVALFLLTNMGKNQMLESNDTVVLQVPDNAEGNENGRYVTYKGKNYQYNENITSILCMGIDKEALVENNQGYGTNGDADVLFLVTLDTVSGKTNLISISRDTMAEIDAYSMEGKYIGTKNQQICLAYAYGDGKKTSCENQVAAVRRMFYNVPVNSYFALDLTGISALNDAVGGVEVECLETFGEFTKGETVTLIGDMAEHYVRLRDVEKLESNFLRMERQKQFIQGFFSKVVLQTKQDIMTPINLYNEATPYMETNINVSKATYLAGNILQKKFSELNMQTVPGELKQGEVYAEYYVNEEEFYEMFLNVFYTPVE